MIYIGVATGLRAGKTKNRIPVWERDYSLLLKTSRLALEPIQVTFSGHRSLKLTTHLHLERKLKISGTVSLLNLHTFMAWKGKTFLTLLYYLTSVRCFKYREESSWTCTKTHVLKRSWSFLLDWCLIWSGHRSTELEMTGSARNRITTEPSRNHRCSTKAISITYYESVLVALVNQHAIRMRHIAICRQPGLQNVNTLSHKQL